MNQENKQDRLKKIIAENGGSQIKIAEKMGVNQHTISEMVNGKRAIGRNTINNLYITFGINPKWMETGEGEMYLERKTEKTDEETVTVPKSVLDAINRQSETMNKQADAIIAQQQTIIKLADLLGLQFSDSNEPHNEPGIS